MNDNIVVGNGSRQALRAEWSRHVSAYKVSGMSKVAFCREHGLVVSKLHYWIRALQKYEEPASDFVELSPLHSAPGSGVWISCGRFQVHVDAHFNSRVLRCVVEALS